MKVKYYNDKRIKNMLKKELKAALQESVEYTHRLINQIDKLIEREKRIKFWSQLIDVSSIRPVSTDDIVTSITIKSKNEMV